MLDLLVVVGAVYRDLARLHRLRNFSHQVDLQETAFERRILHLDVIGQIEHATEGAGGDALIEILTFSLLGLAALDRKHVLLGGDVDLIRDEAGECQRDLILVLAGALDIVGRVVLSSPVQRAVSSRRSSMRSKPTVERQSGVKS